MTLILEQYSSNFDGKHVPELLDAPDLSVQQGAKGDRAEPSGAWTGLGKGQSYKYLQLCGVGPGQAWASRSLQKTGNGGGRRARQAPYLGPLGQEGGGSGSNLALTGRCFQLHSDQGFDIHNAFLTYVC